MPEPTSKPVADVFGVLIRLFFSRFFDKESLSPQGDPEANVIQTLGILAAPGAFVSLLLFFASQGMTGWNLVSVRCLFLTVSMVVIAFIVVFEWDALFLDLRELSGSVAAALAFVETIRGQGNCVLHFPRPVYCGP